MNDLRKDFKNYLELNDFNHNYYYRIKTFLEYCQTHNVAFEKITHSDLQTYLLEMKKTGMANGSFNNKLFAIRRFYKFLIDLGLASQTNLTLIETFKPLYLPKKLKPYITKEELQQIISMGETFIHHITPLKLRCILYFLFYTGLRKGEFINLKRSDIDLANCSVHVRIPTKNRRERTVFFPARIKKTKKRPPYDFVKMLRDYFNAEPEKLNAFNFGACSLINLIKALSAFAPNDKLNIHMFRHSFGRMLAKSGVDSTCAQKLLGHSDIATTQIYYEADMETIQKDYKHKIK